MKQIIILLTAVASVLAMHACNEEYIPVTSLVLDCTEFTIDAGGSFTLQATVLPENATAAKLVEWKSSDTLLAKVDNMGNVTAYATGNVEIMAKIPNTLTSAYCKVTVTEKTYPYYDEFTGEILGYGVNINGVIWAPVNCGFHKTDYPYGKLYQWGRSAGQGYKAESAGGIAADKDEPSIEETLYFGDTIDPSVYYIGTESGQWMTNYDGFGIFNDETDWNDLSEKFDGYEGIGNPCPQGWKVPSYNDWAKLLGGGNINDVCSVRERLGDTPLGQAGRWFGPNHNAATVLNPNGCIFLPFPGERDPNTTNAQMREGGGGYWASTARDGAYSTDDVGFLFYIAPSSIIFGKEFAFKVSYGYSVRCIKDME